MRWFLWKVLWVEKGRNTLFWEQGHWSAMLSCRSWIGVSHIDSAILDFRSHIYVVSVLAPLSLGGGTVPSTYRHDPFQACSHICYQLPLMEGNTSCRCSISQAGHMRVPKRGSEISLNFLDVQLSREIMLPRCAGRGEGGERAPCGKRKVRSTTR